MHVSFGSMTPNHANQSCKTNYTLNTTDAYGNDISSDFAGFLTGNIIFSLPVSGLAVPTVPQPWSLGTSVNSNVANIDISFGSATPFSFDDEDRLTLIGTIDDTVVPWGSASTPKPYYRWAICDTIYPTLNWIQGKGKAENPTCQKVNVTRVYA